MEPESEKARLSVRVIQALNIPAMDDTGTSDPYVILTCGAMKKRTKVQMKTLHPQWHEDFDFFFQAGTVIPSMEIEMWDRDPSSRDDIIGKATVAIGGLTDLRQRQEWVKLSNNDKDTGKLQLFLAMEPKVGSSESPLKDVICEWFSSEEAMMSFWENMAGGVSGKRAATSGRDSDDLPPALLKITVMRGTLPAQNPKALI